MSRTRGYVTEHSRGKWRVRWSVPKKDGKYQRESKVIAGTKKAAQAFLTAELAKLDRGVHVESTKLTLNEWLDSWLTTQAKSVSVRTLANTSSLLSTHVRPVLGDFNLQSITVRQAQDLIDRLSERRSEVLSKQHRNTVQANLSPRTHQVVRRVLSQALDDAVRLELENLAE